MDYWTIVLVDVLESLPGTAFGVLVLLLLLDIARTLRAIRSILERSKPDALWWRLKQGGMGFSIGGRIEPTPDEQDEEE